MLRLVAFVACVLNMPYFAAFCLFIDYLWTED